MAIDITNTDNRLIGHCEALIRTLANVNILNGFSPTVVIHPNFESLPESAQDAIRRSPAAFRNTSQELLINEAIFFPLDADTQIAVMAHEIGHAAHNRGGRIPNLPANLQSCIIADVWACSWGFTVGLLKERRVSRGEEYCRILSEHPIDSVGELLVLWHMQRLAGIV
jgi:hypothetical protein